jgi:hypothetical protein
MSAELRFGKPSACAGILEAEKKFRRINGYRYLQLLHIVLAAHQAAVDEEEKKETSKAAIVV